MKIGERLELKEEGINLTLVNEIITMGDGKRMATLNLRNVLPKNEKRVSIGGHEDRCSYLRFFKVSINK